MHLPWRVWGNGLRRLLQRTLDRHPVDMSRHVPCDFADQRIELPQRRAVLLLWTEHLSIELPLPANAQVVLPRIALPAATSSRRRTVGMLGGRDLHFGFRLWHRLQVAPQPRSHQHILLVRKR